MSSGKDITPPRRSQMEEYRALIGRCGKNAHDRAHVLICALIGDRVDTIGAIIDVAVRLDFSRGHIAHRLRDGEGIYWRRSKEGIFSLIEPQS